MGDPLLFQDHIGQPDVWNIVFHRKAATPWVNRWIPDQFKHVSAVGWCEEVQAWVFYDPCIDKTRIWLSKNNQHAGDWMGDGPTISMPAMKGRGQGSSIRFGFWCVPAVAHLVGLSSGAVLPSTLLRLCLANGGTVLFDVQSP